MRNLLLIMDNLSH